MRVHVLKCWPESFGAILSGMKKYEVRKDDRGFMVGDVLRLREWEPAIRAYIGTPGVWEQLPACAGEYTGRAAYFMVTFKTHGGSWGLPPEVCVLGINPTTAPKEHSVSP